MAHFSKLHAGQQIGPYVIEQSLGQGGMGQVFRVRRGPKHYALKVLHDLSTESLERFQREAEALVAMEHQQGFVRVHGFAMEPIPHLVMELIQGQTLQNWFAENLEDLELPERLPLAMAMFKKLTAAVARLHRKGLTHRDLKPANILIVANEPIVIDFGLIFGANLETLTQTGLYLGTPKTMAPEQWRDGPERGLPTVDIWALGVIFHFLCTGHYPFSGKTPLELIKQQKQSHLDAIYQGLPAAVNHVLRSTLVIDPQQRSQSAQKLLRHLESRPNSATRPKKSVFAAIFFATLAVIIGGLWFLQLQNQSKQTDKRNIIQLRKEVKTSKSTVRAEIAAQILRDYFQQNSVQRLELVKHNSEAASVYSRIRTKLKSLAKAHSARLKKYDPFWFDPDTYEDLLTAQNNGLVKSDFQTAVFREIQRQLKNSNANLHEPWKVKLPKTLEPIKRSYEIIEKYQSGQIELTYELLEENDLIDGNLFQQIQKIILTKWFDNAIFQGVNESSVKSCLIAVHKFGANKLNQPLKEVCSRGVENFDQQQAFNFFKKLQRLGFGKDYDFPTFPVQFYKHVYDRGFDSNNMAKIESFYAIMAYALCFTQHKKRLKDVLVASAIFMQFYFRDEVFKANPTQLTLGVRTLIMSLEANLLAPDFLPALFYNLRSTLKLGLPDKNLDGPVLKLQIAPKYRKIADFFQIAINHARITRMESHLVKRQKAAIRLLELIAQNIEQLKDYPFLQAYLYWIKGQNLRRGYRAMVEFKETTVLWQQVFRKLNWPQDKIIEHIEAEFQQSLDLGFRTRHLVFQDIADLYKLPGKQNSKLRLHYLEKGYEHWTLFRDKFSEETKTETVAEDDYPIVGIHMGGLGSSGLDALLKIYAQRDWKLCLKTLNDISTPAHFKKYAKIISYIHNAHPAVSVDRALQELNVTGHHAAKIKTAIQELRDLQQK